MANSSLGGFHHIAAFGSLELKIHPCCTADSRHVNLFPLGRRLVVLDELLWKFYFCCAALPVFSFQRKNVVEIIVLLGIPSLTTIAAVGWGALELFSEEKFWGSKLHQAGSTTRLLCAVQAPAGAFPPPVFGTLLTTPGSCSTALGCSATFPHGAGLIWL